MNLKTFRFAGSLGSMPAAIICEYVSRVDVTVALTVGPGLRSTDAEPTPPETVASTVAGT